MKDIRAMHEVIDVVARPGVGKERFAEFVVRESRQSYVCSLRDVYARNIAEHIIEIGHSGNTHAGKGPTDDLDASHYVVDQVDRQRAILTAGKKPKAPLTPTAMMLRPIQQVAETRLFAL